MAYGYMRGTVISSFSSAEHVDWLEEASRLLLIDAVGLLDTSALSEAHPTDAQGGRRMSRR